MTLQSGSITMDVRLNFLVQAVCRTTERVRVGECLQIGGSGASTIFRNARSRERSRHHHDLLLQLALHRAT